MAGGDKLLEAFRTCDGPFRWNDFLTVLHRLGYQAVKTGRTGGSRRRFIHAVTKHKVLVHEPHGKDMKTGVVKAIRDDLVRKGIL